MKKPIKECVEEIRGYSECSNRHTSDILRLAAVLWHLNHDDVEAIKKALAEGAEL